jgi:hypothetical protein
MRAPQMRFRAEGESKCGRAPIVAVARAAWRERRRAAAGFIAAQGRTRAALKFAHATATFSLDLSRGQIFMVFDSSLPLKCCHASDPRRE